MAADLRMSVSMVNNTKSVFNALNTSFKNLANLTKNLAVEMDKMNKSAAATQLSKMQKELDGLAKTTGKAAKEFTKQADATSKAAAAQGKFASEIKGVSTLYNDYYQKLGKTELAHKRATKEATKWENAVMGTAAQLVATGNKVGTFTKNFDALGAQAALTSKDIKKVGDVLVPVTAAGERALGMNKKQAEALRKLNNVQTDYKKVLDKNAKISYVYSDAVQSLGKQFGYGSKEVAIWSKALDQTATATKNSRIALKAQTGNVDTATKAYRKHVASIDPVLASQKILSGDLSVVNGKFKALTSEGLRTLGVSSEEAGRRLGVLSAGFKRTQEESGRFGRAIQFIGNKLKSFVAYTVAAATTAAALGTAMKAFTTNIQFSQALKDLEAITRATTEEMGLLDAKIREVAGITKFSAGEIAEGMKLLGQSGFSALETIGAIEGVANLATGTLSTMNTSVELVTSALRVFKDENINASDAADIFTNAVNNSKLTVDKIQTAMNYLGPIAARAGVSLKDTSASMMVLANTGMRASSIATGLRRVFKELVSPTDKMKKAIREAGLSVEDFDLRANDMQTVIKNLQYVVTDADTAFELFGLRGATAASALATQGVEAFEKMQLAVQLQGTAAENAAIQVEGLGIIYKQIGDKAANLALAMGDAGLNGVLRVFGNTVRYTLDRLTDLVGLPAARWFVGLTSAAAAFIALQIGASMVKASAAMAAFGAATKAATARILAMNVAILANPWGMAIAGITILLGLMYKHHKATEKTIKNYTQLKADALKVASALDAEIAQTKKFNGTAAERLDLVNKLADAYPKWTTEIYNASDSGEALAKVLEKIQKSKIEEAVEATTEKVKLLSQELVQSARSVKLHAESVKAAGDEEELAAERRRNLGEATSKYNAKLKEIALQIMQIENLGEAFDFAEVFGDNLPATREYVAQLKEIIARERETQEAEKTSLKTRKETLATKIEEAEVDKEKAAVALRTAEIEAKNAKANLASLAKRKVSEQELLSATQAVNKAEEKVRETKQEVIRTTKALLEVEKRLIELKADEYEIQAQIAEIFGDGKAQAIAEENKAYQERLKYLNETLDTLVETGRQDTEIYRQTLLAKAKLLQNHLQRKVEIEEEYADKEREIAERQKEALKELNYEAVTDIEEVGEAILERRQAQYRRELSDLQDNLRDKMALEGDHTDVVMKLVAQIEDKKKSIYTTEKKLIQQRTKDIEASYDLEMTIIDNAEKRELARLETRNIQGSVSKEEYEKEKLEIETKYLQMRLNQARAYYNEISALENASVEDIKAAKEKMLQAEAEYHIQAEQAAAKRKQIAKEAHEERLAQIEEESKAEEKAASKRERVAAAAANFITGLYNEVGNALVEVGAKAASLGSQGNLFIEAIAENAALAGDEVAQWALKLDAAQKKTQGFKDAMLRGSAAWAPLWKDLADKWREAANAIREKLQYTKDIRALDSMEISHYSDVEAAQRKLNQIREEYTYLGQEDLQNLQKAKSAVQEQINQQRILNQEKENAARLEKEQANTDAINAAVGEIERLQEAGKNIEDYGFAPEDASRLEEIKKESAEIKAQISAQRLADAQHLQFLEAAGELTDAQKQEERELAQERLEGLLDVQEMLSLESQAITDRLDIEKGNLLELNEMKIEQAEEEEERARIAHEKALEWIEAENAKRLEGVESFNQQMLEALKSIADATQGGISHNWYDPFGTKKDNTTKMARGGQLPGESTIDSIPVLARPGEWFIRNESARSWTQNFGSGFMKGINEPLSAAGQAIKSALQGASVVPAPASAPVPKTNFSTGGQVVRYDKDDGALTKVLNRIEKALSDNKRNDEGTRRSVSVNIQSGGQQVVGNFTEEDAKNLMAMLQKQQGFAG